jgi:SAM-dependent methyltransferase
LTSGEAPGPGAEADRLEALYDRYAASRRKRRDWAAANPGNVAIRRELLAAVLELAAAPLRDGGAVLDVGCGSGWLLAELAARGTDPARLHGVDLIERRVEAAARRVPGASVRRADARSLPFGEDSFGLVVLLTALSSMPSDEAIAAALAEAARVVSPGGLVLCYEPRLANPFNRSTRRVAGRGLAASLGAPVASRTLTGLPPLARRLGRATDRLYPPLARIAPTHQLTAHSPAGAPRPPG